MKECYNSWREFAREQCYSLFLQNNPSRLLEKSCLTEQGVTTRLLIKALDFERGEEKGIEWIDVMRSETSVFSKFSLRSGTDKRVVDYISRLLIVDKVWDNLVAHSELLENKKMKWSQFRKETERELESQKCSYLWLQNDFQTDY